MYVCMVCARVRARICVALCSVSFIFKINYVDSKPKSAVKFRRENSRRCYAVEFLSCVTIKWKIVIHVYRGCSSSRGPFPGASGKPTFNYMCFTSCYERSLVSSQRYKRAREGPPRQIGCFIEQYRDPR